MTISAPAAVLQTGTRPQEPALEKISSTEGLIGRVALREFSAYGEHPGLGLGDQTPAPIKSIGSEGFNDKNAALKERLSDMSNKDKQALLSRVHTINNLKFSFSRTKITSLIFIRTIACLATLPISASISIALAMSKEPEYKVRMLRKKIKEYQACEQNTEKLEADLSKALTRQKIAAYFVRNLSFHALLRSALMRQSAGQIIQDSDSVFYSSLDGYRTNALKLVKEKVFDIVHTYSRESFHDHEQMVAALDQVKEKISEDATVTLGSLEEPEQIKLKLESKLEIIKSLVTIEEIDILVNAVFEKIESEKEQENELNSELETAFSAINSSATSPEEKKRKKIVRDEIQLKLMNINNQRVEFITKLVDDITIKLLKKRRLKDLVKEIVDQSPPIVATESSYRPFSPDSKTINNAKENNLLPVGHIRILKRSIGNPFTERSIGENAKSILSSLFSRTRASFSQE